MTCTLSETSHTRRSALIVIDMQNDFCAPGGYFDRTGADLSAIDQLADRLISLIDAARRYGVMVLFVRSAYDPIYLSEVQKNRRRRVGWDIPLCRDNTWGVQFFRITPLPEEPIVTKHRYDAFYGTDLELILQGNDKRNLFFAGVATNVCVETSLRSAFIRDFNVTLIADCAAARTRTAHEATLDTVRGHFGLVETSDDVQRAWSEMHKSMA
jgi:ureidoacrylate peracid hydrolase